MKRLYCSMAGVVIAVSVLFLLGSIGFGINQTKTSADEMIAYNGKEFKTSELSEDTVEWLQWYNQLSKSEQEMISYVPSDLVQEPEKSTVSAVETNAKMLQ